MKNIKKIDNILYFWLSLVLQGMAEVAKERPENPIKYLADFLMKHANDK